MGKNKYDEMFNVLARDLFSLQDITDFSIHHVNKMLKKGYGEEFKDCIIAFKQRVVSDLDSMIVSVDEVKQDASN